MQVISHIAKLEAPTLQIRSHLDYLILAANILRFLLHRWKS